MAEPTRITAMGNPTFVNGKATHIRKSPWDGYYYMDNANGTTYRLSQDNVLQRPIYRGNGAEPDWENVNDAGMSQLIRLGILNAQPNVVQKGVHWLGRKIGDNKVGNWLQRFQEGGEVNSQINLDQVVAALQEDPEGTIDQLLQLGEQGQQILEALSQDPNIGQMIASILQQKGMAPAQQKNGGAIKKADCGCKATLKRMGGRIVNVDCTGKIVK